MHVFKQLWLTPKTSWGKKKMWSCDRCKWVYRLKETSYSITPKYKARLVAKGFRQEYGVDFDEIFSPVVKMTTLHFMLGVVAADNLELIQLDVKTAFLHRGLKEEIYIEQPKVFVASGTIEMHGSIKSTIWCTCETNTCGFACFDEIGPQLCLHVIYIRNETLDPII